MKDYSLGGVAFFMGPHLELKKGDQLIDIELRFPQGMESLDFYVPLAVVRRIEAQPRGKTICGLEFLAMQETTREMLWQHVFKEERLSLRKTKKV